MKDDLSKARVVEFEGTGTYEEWFGSGGANFKAAVAQAERKPAPGSNGKRVVEEIIRVSYDLYISNERQL